MTTQQQTERDEALIAEAEKPVPQGCTLGVGCDEYGICYAEAHGQPEQCGRNVPGDDYRKAAALLRASPAPEPEAFKRENRYIVIKRSHVHPMKEATLRQEMYELGSGCGVAGYCNRAEGWDEVLGIPARQKRRVCSASANGRNES